MPESIAVAMTPTQYDFGPALSELGLAALSYSQELGWPVFPVEPCGKRPLIANGFHGATTHPEQIAAWWDRWPHANIGFCPGSHDLIVVDIDGPEGERLADNAGVLEIDTLEVRTARGVHRYFRLPAGVTIGNVARAQLDVRAHNGYVLVPPSVHSSGHVYTWRGVIE